MTERLVGLGALLTLQPEPEREHPSMVVRLGASEQIITSPREQAVWQVLSSRPLTLDELSETVVPVTPADAGPASFPAGELLEVVESLRARALVIGIDLDDPSSARLAIRLRAVPLQRAVGSILADAGRFAIGTAELANGTLFGRLHGLWSRLDDAWSIASVGVGYATLADEPLSDRHLLEALRDCLDLVERGAAYLDAAVRSLPD